jgi:hypothetical protein
MLGHMMDMLRTGVDFLLDQGFVADAMLKAGFSSVRSRTLETPMGCMDLDIARKNRCDGRRRILGNSCQRGAYCVCPFESLHDSVKKS